jgi:hypothetical protein
MRSKIAAGHAGYHPRFQGDEEPECCTESLRRGVAYFSRPITGNEADSPALPPAVLYLASMLWLCLFALLTVAGTLGTVVNVNRLRFERAFAREVRELVSAPASGTPLTDLAELPPPVARYRQLAVGEHSPVHTLRLRHGGTFRLSPSATPSPIQGRQAFSADPPGFLWLGTIRMAPGVWIHARDRLVREKGSMLVLLDNTVRLANASGPQLDQGAALRLLAEMVWFPTALFDARHVTWRAVDAEHALATLRLGQLSVSATFEFGPDGLPTGVLAQRFMDPGGLHSWRGDYRDWRTVSGLRVPFEADVTWQLEAGPYTYAHWTVDSMEYDAPAERE